MRLIDRGISGFKLQVPRTAGGHGDLGIAFVEACLAAERYPRYGGWEPGCIGTGGGLRRRMPRGVFHPDDDGHDKYGNRPSPLSFLN